MKISLLSLVALLLLALFASSVSAQETYLDFDHSHFALKLGFINTGDVKLGELNTTSRSALSIGGTFDCPIGKEFFVAIDVDLHRMEWKGPWEDRGEQAKGTMAELGVGLKRLVYLGQSQFAVRPGFIVGFGALGRMYNTDGSNYVTARPSLEFLAATSETLGLVLETGVWFTLSGSDNDRSITLGPQAIVRAGLVF